nr:hypothetical protein [Pantoea sp. JZ2]
MQDIIKGIIIVAAVIIDMRRYCKNLKQPGPQRLQLWANTLM